MIMRRPYAVLSLPGHVRPAAAIWFLWCQSVLRSRRHCPIPTPPSLPGPSQAWLGRSRGGCAPQFGATVECGQPPRRARPGCPARDGTAAIWLFALQGPHIANRAGNWSFGFVEGGSTRSRSVACVLPRTSAPSRVKSARGCISRRRANLRKYPLPSEANRHLREPERKARGPALK